MPLVCPKFDDYFDNQRKLVRKILGNNSEAVVKFRDCMHNGQNDLANRPNANATLFYESPVKGVEQHKGKSIVFMGMKSLPENVAFAICVYGITAFKYLSKAPLVESFDTTAPPKSDKTKANGFRAQFKGDRHFRDGGLDEFELLNLANAHKSGPGVITSGYHSTSGKPEYAAEYSVGGAQKKGATGYNLGVAIAISDECYPLIIQNGIETWNEKSDDDRGGKDKKITMAFAKEEKAWERDYESEILLGGASPSTDFAYIGLWKVHWPETSSPRFALPPKNSVDKCKKPLWYRLYINVESIKTQVALQPVA